MKARRFCRYFIWAIALGIAVTQGCAGTSSTGTPNSTSPTAAPSAVVNASPEDQSVTPAEMAPFLGKWKGTWEWQGRGRATSSSSESKPVELVVEMASGKPFAIWAVGAGGGKRPQSYSQGGSWRYPAKFNKKNGVVYMEFTTGKGDNIEFHIEGNELHGGNTSAGYVTQGTLKKISE